ncbi:methyl-accepting chemotaxis protein [Muricoccus pecuniae]|uniref:Methyl-accepting chemotaxis protein n=1 Tax=Muricoccus pecuniae TaxID=693023 RepID=A0A840XTV0_9PROT|nr:methyl-accepting chemotaxis protein [Roseomonas pecuniae]MBB5692128.1 methyl-accepting chemotaxis protein [Roseomonas pecuniae]
MPRRLSDWPIAARLHLCTLVAVMGLIGLAAYEIRARSTELEEARIGTLRAVVESGASIAAHFEKEERTGRMDRAAAQAAAAAEIRAFRYGGNEYLWVNDAQPSPRLIAHPFRPDLEGKDVSGIRDPNGFALFIAFAEKARQSGSGVVGYLWPRPGAQAGEPPVEKLSFVQGFAPWNWVIGTGVYVDDLRAAQRELVLRGGLIAGAAALVVGLLTWTVGRGITRPLARVTAATAAMAGGDLGTEVPGAERRDELGLLARALETFRENGLKARRLEEAAAAERAARERRHAAMERHTQDFGASVSGVLAMLGKSAEDMRAAAADMSEVVERTRGGAESTASGAEESSRNLASVAAATEQLSASVAEIARQVAQSASATKAAVERAQSTDAAVRGLSDAADQIGEVVRLITDIAGQTNLLALNATIEAARAGEAGRGFAVVAGEVKTLANQTASATDRIGRQIQAVQAATGEAVQSVREMSAAIGEISSVAGAIAAAVEQQGAATREIASSVQHVSRTTEDATGAMREVAKAADRARGSSDSVSTAARDVAGVSGTLRTEVDHFLRAMRSGGEEKDRRRYERIPARGVRVTLRSAKLPGAGTEVELKDISRGGAALVLDWEADTGTGLELAFPGVQGPIPARVVRAQGGVVSVVFRQDEESAQRIDRVLDRIGRAAKAA